MNIFPNNVFIHHVFFWLKEAGNNSDKQKLIDGLKKLPAITVILSWHIGIPAVTSRGVIDNTYNVSWLILFNSKEDQDSYQTRPIHLQFVEECSHLWKKVVVYDTVDDKK